MVSIVIILANDVSIHQSKKDNPNDLRVGTNVFFHQGVRLAVATKASSVARSLKLRHIDLR